MAWDAIVATPLLLGTRVLGWMTVCSRLSSNLKAGGGASS
jgi:hypothetical protein